MPKRSAQDKIESLQRKIKKLQEEEHRTERDKNRRRIRRLPSSSEDEQDEQESIQRENLTEPHAGPSNSIDVDQAQPQAAQDEQLAETTTSIQDATAMSGQDTAVLPGQDVAGLPLEVDLDPELLLALGASTSDTPDFGVNIHESLVKLWTPLLKKGLQKEDKDKLTKEYLVPGNCKLLQAPKLNAEITAAVSDTVRGRDKKLATFQQQLGTGTSAVNRAMDTLIASDNKILALKQLSDACRIFSDLHCVLTKDRIKLITPSLEKNFLHILQDTERDDTLFGNALSEKIKASKAIQRQGSQIRKTIPFQKTTPSQSTVNRPAPQGNWSGPPRYPSNRGGRGGQRRPAPAVRRPYNPTQIPVKSFNQTKTRAAPPQ